MTQRDRDLFRKRRMQKRKRQRLIKMIGTVAAIIIAIIGIAFGVMSHKVKQVGQNVACNNIYIGQVDVSGKTAQEIEELLEQKTKEYRKKKVVLHVGEESAELTFSELGLKANNADKLAKEAVAYAKDGSLFSRYKKIKALEKEKIVLDDAFVINKKKTQKLFDEEIEPLEVKAKDATIQRSGAGFIIDEEEKGYAVDEKKSMEVIENYINEKWEYGDAEIKLVTVVDKPKITKKQLSKIEDELGSFSTNAGGGVRVTNLKRGAELLNGRVVLPGEVFSVEEATKPYTLDNGYVEAGSYLNGALSTSIAGGICQVSTTLYNALLYSEVQIVERSSHSMSVSYVDPSRDAAIAEGLKDLKFKNNYDAPIFIEGYVDAAGQLQFHIYGKDTRSESREVKFESETLEKKEYTIKYVADSASALGSMNQSGSIINGSVARLWKVVYENGTEVSRDVVNNSNYRASEVQMSVGTYSDNPEATALVEAAIKTQDKGKIEEAIRKAKNLKTEKTEEKTDDNNESEGQ